MRLEGVDEEKKGNVGCQLLLRQDQSTPTRGLQLLGSAGEGTNHMSHPLDSPASLVADISGYDVIGPDWVSIEKRRRRDTRHHTYLTILLQYYHRESTVDLR